MLFIFLTSNIFWYKLLDYSFQRKNKICFPFVETDLKMSERHSSQACPGAGNEVDHPAVNFKHSSFRDFCSTSSFQDSGYNELLQPCNFENADKEFFGEKEKGPTLIHEHPETSNLGLTHTLESPTQKKRFFFSRKENDKTPELCETPKVSGKKTFTA